MGLKSERAESGARQQELPTFYYRQHFLELLDFVAAHYGHVLDPEQARLIEKFRVLPSAPQCLYVRLVNRKGRVFDPRRMKYPEIGSLGDPLARLAGEGWVAAPTPDDFEDVLTALTRSEIHSGLAGSHAGVSRSWKKAQLVQFALERCDPAAFTGLAESHGLFVQQRTDWVGFLGFLYFGECQDGLSRFTMRDMGLVQTHSFRESYEPRFSDRDEALECYFFASRQARFRRGSALDQRAVIAGVSLWPEPASERAAELRDDLAFLIGRHLEKEGRGREAMDVYRRGETHACNERLTRLLLASGQREVARRHLEDTLQFARSEEERLFAADLIEQKFSGKRTSVQTDVLRAAETIQIDESQSGSPERAAIAHFEARGQRAFRAENTLWRSLFGTLFWHELFTSDLSRLHSPFEALPASLNERSFYEAHEDAIESRLAGLADIAATKRRLLQVFAAHYGTSNGVFRWRKSDLETIIALIETASPQSVATMLRNMCRDYPSFRYGWPDLLVIDSNSDARFVEIKSEGDQLRRGQLARIVQMRNAGLCADVIRIRWVLDPQQVYVVVDVETTGGRGDRHRITEVAAVKVQGRMVVGRYQSLINPQRPIPPGITRLTGISDAMVADAPVFAEIADELQRFMGDAIFVAHNVNFDYGFISREYARLGRKFRHAKLCTCASMRKLFPGHDSYSLASLCRRYEIALRQHHRALCDAEAAAQLLLLINEKRASELRS